MSTKDTLKKAKKKLLLFGYTIAMINSLPQNAIAASTIENNINNVQTVKNNDCEPHGVKEIITYYSKVFGIKEEYIYDMYEYTTDCYNDYNYENLEELIIRIAKNLYYNGQEYVNNLDNHKTNTEYMPTKTPEELIEKYCNIFDINKTTALAISYNECGIDMKSRNFRVNNNPAGIGPFMYFENYEIGIIYYVLMLKDNYHCTIDSDKSFLGSIARIYCPDTPEMWYNDCSYHYNNILEDYYYNVPEIKKEKEEEKQKYKIKK